MDLSITTRDSYSAYVFMSRRNLVEWDARALRACVRACARIRVYADECVVALNRYRSPRSSGAKVREAALRYRKMNGALRRARKTRRFFRLDRSFNGCTFVGRIV